MEAGGDLVDDRSFGAAATGLNCQSLQSVAVAVVPVPGRPMQIDGASLLELTPRGRATPALIDQTASTNGGAAHCRH
jgi:hypothetical protein